MTFHSPVTPWRTLTVAQGNVVQFGGLLAAAAMIWHAGQRGRQGARWMYAGRLLAYLCEHASMHWLVGRLGGIRFTGYGVQGSTHARLYPPGMRAVFAHLPLFSARLDPASRTAASPTAQAAMYAAGPLVTVLLSVLIPWYCSTRRVPHARGLLIGSSVWMLGMLIGEALRSGGDLRRAWYALRHR